MSKKNRDGKPTKFQLDALKALKADMKGIKTYRDAENALKRLRKAKPAQKKAAKPAKKVSAKKPTAGKCVPAKPASKKPIKGTDSVRIPLPKVTCKKDCDCRHITVEINVIHDDIFSSDQMKNIDKLAEFCSASIVKLCDEFARSNGLFSKPACTCKDRAPKALPAKKPAKKPLAVKKPAKK